MISTLSNAGGIGSTQAQAWRAFDFGFLMKLCFGWLENKSSEKC